jgi:hypothetical protein
MQIKLLRRLVGFGLVVVLRSEKDGIKVGDHMFGMTLFEAYTVQPYIEGNRPSDTFITETPTGYQVASTSILLPGQRELSIWILSPYKWSLTPKVLFRGLDTVACWEYQVYLLSPALRRTQRRKKCVIILIESLH